MTIELNTLVFGLTTLAFAVGMIIHLFKEGYQGGFISGKRKGELGGWGWILIFLYLMFLLIYGGFCWW